MLLFFSCMFLNDDLAAKCLNINKAVNNLDIKKKYIFFFSFKEHFFNTF